MKSIRPLPLYAALLAFVAVALFLFAARPLRERIASENEGIQKLHANAENEQRKISDLPKYRAQAEEIIGEETRLRLLLPADRIVDFIRGVEDVAKGVGGTVIITQGKDLAEIRKSMPATAGEPVGTADTTEGSTQSVGGTAEKGRSGTGLVSGLQDGRTLGLTLQFSGPYSDAVVFLHKVETMPYFLDVLSVNIRPVSGNSNVMSSRSDLFTSAVSSPSVQRKIAVSADAVDAEFSIIVYLE
ncbi:MAG TPA: hypothetical protein VN420_00785 [Candidatus Fimivivens sp.]|nr:hypothetical protein [Candidatus Fimivivens sp.]